jgi:putative transposase
VLSALGRLAVRWSRPLGGTPKTDTVVREADGWYVACSCAEVPTEPLPPTGKQTGIDRGLPVFLVTADGEVVAHPRHSRRGEQRLAKAQPRLSRRQQGGNRRLEYSGCGARVSKNVRGRTHVCPSCGLVLDREENTARNMQRAGQARQGAVALATVVH